MPLTRFKLSAIEDGGIATADLADDAVTTAKIDDGAVTLAKTDSLFVNTEISGTEAARMPVGTTAQRANAQSGDIRFNSSLNLMEYYDGTQWKSIDSPPVVSSISPTTESDASANITITGSNFQSGATVKFIGDDGTEYTSPSVTFNSATEIVATTPSTALTVANEPYDIQVTNPSGLAATLADGLDAGGLPAFDTAAGSIGTIYDSTRSSYSLSAVTATDPDGDAVTYALGSGDSLPAGLSLNASTGAITGTATAVGSDTTTTFDIVATSQGETSTRSFSITVNAPVIASYTSSSGSFSVPSGITAVDVLVVAGGGSSGSGASGGGGAGGLIYRPAFPVTPGGSVSYSVGAGGPTSIGNGQDSTFGGLTAKGGGYGGTKGAGYNGNPGGSGGGASRDSGRGPQSYGGAGATGTQPQQPGDSGTYGFGTQGGNVGGDSYSHGGGGGGAGGQGANSNNDYPGPGDNGKGTGGVGKQYDISGSQVYYAGGGGGGYIIGPAAPSGGAAGGQGGGGTGGGDADGTPGTANRGGGGGGNEPNGSTANDGGSGIVIVKY